MPTIAPSTIYANPSIWALTNTILRLSEEQDLSANTQKESRLRVRDELLQEFRSRIDQIQSPTTWNQKFDRQVVILTGSTGVLGSYILDSLVANPSIAHVFCLNTKIDSSSYQIEKNKSLGLSTPLDPARVTFVTANLSESGLGLHEKMLEKLRNSVTHTYCSQCLASELQTLLAIIQSAIRGIGQPDQFRCKCEYIAPSTAHFII